MFKRTISSEPNKICDAEDCSAIAQEEVQVSVGQMGEIILSVCNNCKPKFTHDVFHPNEMGMTR